MSQALPERCARPVRFFHRGAIAAVRDAAPTRSVLQWLREDQRRCGTKEGCNEGDCGACTVVLGSRADDGTLALRSVNACLTLLPMIDGQALFTVEDLKTIAGGALHPVQQALVECHGSQCGFCTPGFAMSMTACYERHHAAGTRPDRQQLAAASPFNRRPDFRLPRFFTTQNIEVSDMTSNVGAGALTRPTPERARELIATLNVDGYWPTPLSATRSLPVMPRSMAPSAQRTGMSSVRRKVTSIGMSRTRANRLRSWRRKLRPACLSRSPASSLSRPLLGTPMRRLDMLGGSKGK